MDQWALCVKVHLDTPRGSAGLRGGGLRGADGLRGGTTGHRSDGNDEADGAKGARPGAAGATAAPAKWSLGARHELRAKVGHADGRWPPRLSPRAPAWPQARGRRFWGPATGAIWSPQWAIFSRVPRQMAKDRTVWWLWAQGWIDSHGERGEILELIGDLGHGLAAQRQ